MTAGYWGGWWDDLVNGFTNVMLAIPSLIFALAVMAVLGPGLPSLLIALGLTNWSWTCRIARSSTLSLKSLGYVQAAQTLGYGDLRIMFTQILPNMMGPILVMATLGMGSAVLSEAALSFLGLGIQPPFPSWGSMLTDARQLIQLAPWVAIFPGLAIFLSVLGFNLLGDGLRDSLDPHMRTRLEFGFHLLVAWMEIWVQLLCALAVGFADLIRFAGTRNAEYLIGIISHRTPPPI